MTSLRLFLHVLGLTFLIPSILAAVKKAAKFAVYEEIMIRVKNHHIPATIRVEMALKSFHREGEEKMGLEITISV